MNALIFPEKQYGFRKGFIAQHCLLVIIHNWQRCLNIDGENNELRTEVTKGFHCLLHKLFKVKHGPYVFDYKSIYTFDAKLIFQ